MEFIKYERRHIRHMIRNLTASFQSRYNLNDYQMRQLKYLIITFASEISKLVLLGILFYAKFDSFIFATLILLLLRMSSGGLHFKTYWGCLMFSAMYYIFSIVIFPHIPINVMAQIFLLLFCIAINLKIGAVTSSYRPMANDHQLHRARRNIFIILSLYLFTYIIPTTQYRAIGFWVIILHTLQLTAAYMLQKGGYIQHGK
ncbi:accessory gene regulator B family protein [Gallintestinimicrobium propionicum]